MLMIRWWWEGAALVEISTVQAAPLFIFFLSFCIFLSLSNFMPQWEKYILLSVPLYVFGICTSALVFYVLTALLALILSECLSISEKYKQLCTWVWTRSIPLGFRYNTHD